MTVGTPAPWSRTNTVNRTVDLGYAQHVGGELAEPVTLREINWLEAELLRVGEAFTVHFAHQPTAASKRRAAAAAYLASDVQHGNLALRAFNSLTSREREVVAFAIADGPLPNDVIGRVGADG